MNMNGGRFGHPSVMAASLVVLATFWVGAGTEGMLLGVAIVGVSLLLSPLWGFVVGTILMLFLEMALYSFDMLIIGLGLATLVVANVLAEGLPPADAVVGALAFLAFSSVGFLVFEGTESLMSATGFLAGSIVLVLYGLHRYELVELGLVEEAGG